MSKTKKKQADTIGNPSPMSLFDLEISKLKKNQGSPTSRYARPRKNYDLATSTCGVKEKGEEYFMIEDAKRKGRKSSYQVGEEPVNLHKPHINPTVKYPWNRFKAQLIYQYPNKWQDNEDVFQSIYNNTCGCIADIKRRIENGNQHERDKEELKNAEKWVKTYLSNKQLEELKKEVEV